MASSQDPRYPPRPIIVITGGNGGVGLGIALRLLKQLSSPSQTDIAPISSLPTRGVHATSPFATPNGLTIVLASRNLRKAEDAKRELLKAVGKLEGESDRGSSLGAMVNREGEVSSEEEDDEVSKHLLPSKATSARTIDGEEYRKRWLDNLSIDLVPLDLASISSTLECADALATGYPYISHLLLNAGGGPFVGIDWLQATYGVLTDLVTAITWPQFIIEEAGWTTPDHLGWTWQTNLFSHYVLAHRLLPSLASYPRTSASAPRIVWTTSIEAQPYYVDEEDWQALKPNPKSQRGCSYVSVKYQMGLAGWGFNRVIADFERKKGHDREKEGPIAYSVAAQPGITAGLMFVQIIGVILDFFMKLAFYLARFLGSPNHIISPYKAGIAWTYVCLAPLATVLSSAASLPPGGPVRFGSKTTRWGKEYVGIEAFNPDEEEDPKDIYGRKRWFDEKREERVMEYLERMRQTVLRARGSAAE